MAHLLQLQSKKSRAPWGFRLARSISEIHPGYFGRRVPTAAAACGLLKVIRRSRGRLRPQRLSRRSTLATKCHGLEH